MVRWCVMAGVFAVVPVLTTSRFTAVFWITVTLAFLGLHRWSLANRFNALVLTGMGVLILITFFGGDLKESDLWEGEGGARMSLRPGSLRPVTPPPPPPIWHRHLQTAGLTLGLSGPWLLLAYLASRRSGPVGSRGDDREPPPPTPLPR